MSVSKPAAQAGEVETDPLPHIETAAIEHFLADETPIVTTAHLCPLNTDFRKKCVTRAHVCRCVIFPALPGR